MVYVYVWGLFETVNFVDVVAPVGGQRMVGLGDGARVGGIVDRVAGKAVLGQLKAVDVGDVPHPDGGADDSAGERSVGHEQHKAGDGQAGFGDSRRFGGRRHGQDVFEDVDKGVLGAGVDVGVGRGVVGGEQVNHFFCGDAVFDVERGHGDEPDQGDVGQVLRVVVVADAVFPALEQLVAHGLQVVEERVVVLGDAEDDGDVVAQVDQLHLQALRLLLVR